MSFDLYFAGSSVPEADEWIISNKHNRLYSYLNDKSSINRYGVAQFGGNLFVDSGAFTAWTRGNTINTKEYIKWLNERYDKVHLCGQVDSIPGDRTLGATYEQVCDAAQATWNNYLFMRKRLKNPEALLYTFHVGEPFDFLRKALEWKDENGDPISYMALGGMVGKPFKTRDNFLEKCFRIIEQSTNQKIKIHAFGMTDFDLLEKYPITSADSTSWIMVGAMGNIMSDYGNIMVSENKIYDKNHYTHLPEKVIEALDKSLERFGFTLAQLAANHNSRILFNAMYMQSKAEELNNMERKFSYRRGLF